MDETSFITYDSIGTIATSLGDDCTTGGPLSYNYFDNYDKVRAKNLSKQQALETDPKTIQHIDFSENLNRDGNTAIFFFIEEAKEKIFHKEVCKVLQFCFVLMQYQYKITQYRALNVKLPNSQIKKLKSGITNNTEVTLKISYNVIGHSNDENNFPHKLLLTNTEVSRFVKLFQVILQLI